MKNLTCELLTKIIEVLYVSQSYQVTLSGCRQQDTVFVDCTATSSTASTLKQTIASQSFTIMTAARQVHIP